MEELTRGGTRGITGEGTRRGLQEKERAGKRGGIR